MLAGKVRCPKCGAGLVDVAPSYNLDCSSIPGAISSDVSAACRNGHNLFVSWHHRGSITVTVWEPGKSKASEGLEP